MPLADGGISSKVGGAARRMRLERFECGRGADAGKSRQSKELAPGERES